MITRDQAQDLTPFKLGRQWSVGWSPDFYKNHPCPATGRSEDPLELPAMSLLKKSETPYTLTY